MWEKLEQINKRYEEIVRLMSSPEIAIDHVQMTKLAQEKSGMDDLVTKYQEYKKNVQALTDTKAMLEEKLDAEMLAMTKDEAHQLEEKIAKTQEELKLALLPKDPNDEKNIIMEIRAGAGGDEASIFAAELFRMYSRYAEARGWKVGVIDTAPCDVGGFKEIVFSVEGPGVY